MAWDDFEREGQQLWSGDDPLDELTQALRRIAAAYESRFRRRPYLGEILLSLERVLAVRPERFVEDPGGLEGARFACARTDSPARQHIDFTRFEGYYADQPQPGHYGIERRGDREVITMPRFEVVANRILEIDYQILDDSLDDDSAIRLIKRTILRVFSDSSYAAEADTLAFRNVITGLAHTMSYDEY
jgi:hypothetical protein